MEQGRAPGQVDRLAKLRFLEVPGYRSLPGPDTARERASRKDAVAAAVEGDMLILVADASRGDLSDDLSFAREWAEYYVERPTLHRPPALVVVTGFDQPRPVPPGRRRRQRQSPRRGPGPPPGPREGDRGPDRRASRRGQARHRRRARGARPGVDRRSGPALPRPAAAGGRADRPAAAPPPPVDPFQGATGRRDDRQTGQMALAERPRAYRPGPGRGRGGLIGDPLRA